MDKQTVLDFRNDFMRYTDLTAAQISVLAPVLYGQEDRYYEACVQFLKKGEMQNLTYGEYSTDLIMKGMCCSYPEALVIMRNMEQFPDYADFFFVPRMVE